MPSLLYVDKITDPETGTVYEIQDTYAREQLAHKVEKTIVLSLPSKPTTKDAWLAMEPFLYYVPISGQDNEYEAWTLFFVGDPTVASDYTDTNNYVWSKIAETDVDLSNFSTKGHTHEVIPEVDVEDHDYTPQGTVESEFQGNQGTTGDKSHSHTFTPQGSVNGTFSHTGNTGSSTAGVTLTKEKLALQTKILAIHPTTLNLNSTSTSANRATGGLEGLAQGDVYADKALIQGISVSNGVLSFVPKKLSTAGTVTGVSGTVATQTVTFDSSNDVNASVANGNVTSDDKGPILGSNTDVNDPGHTHTNNVSGNIEASFSGTAGTTSSNTHNHTFTPSGKVRSAFIGLRANLKHKVDSKKVRTSPDQEDQGSHIFDWYGILFDVADGDSVKTRVGNMDMHRTLPIQTKMARCLVKDDGTVYNWLDENDSRFYAPGSQDELGNDISGMHAELTGTARVEYFNSGSKTFNVQVKVRIHHHWRKVYKYLDGNKTMLKAMISPYQQMGGGWVEVKEGFISAYEATIIGNSLWSVSNLVPKSGVELYTVQNGLPLCTCDIADAASYSAFMATTGHSILPTSNVNLDGFRAAARQRNVINGVEDTRWNANVYDLYLAMLWLQVIEYANTDSQADFTNVPTAEGFRQGGLGVGCTTVYNWGDWGYLPFVPCGVTNILGNNSGEVLFALPQGLGGGTCRVNSYRGVELGHLWKITDAIKYVGTGSAQEVMRCADPANYGTNNGYVSIGTNCGSSGWKTDIMVGDDGDINCESVGGSSNRYWCDYNYTAVSEGVEYLCLLGGGAGNGSSAGLAYVLSIIGLSTTNTDCGSRLCFYNA